MRGMRLACLGLLLVLATSAGRGGALGPCGRDLTPLGLLDVTAPPFQADSSGQKDSTRAIQAAVNRARDEQLVCFFPPGTYRVSDTIECAQNALDPTTGRVRWTRAFPCVLVGSRRGSTRPKIYLAPHSPGFGDPDHPKVLLHFWARDFVHQRPFAEQDDTSMNQMLVGIDVTVGEGNPGAVAVRHRCAQGSGVQDCTIDVGCGHTGLQGGAGSGGSHANVTVIGGRIGLDLREAQPAPAVVGASLIGQSERAILYDGAQTLTAVGLRVVSQGAGPLIEGLGSGGPDAANGAISLVDSVLVFENPRRENVAIRTARSLTLHDVYIQGAPRAVQFGDGAALPGALGGWVHVAEYARAVRPPVYREPGNEWRWQFEPTVTLDGRRAESDTICTSDGAAPPGDLQTRHLWDGSFPSGESPGATSVKDAPYGARGDGIADDTAAIQRAIDEHDVVSLPKGRYRVTRPLLLRCRTCLVGVARHLSVLCADGRASAFSNPRRPQPLVRTANDPEAPTVMAFLALCVSADAGGAYCLDWECGRRSICRCVNFERPRSGEDLSADARIDTRERKEPAGQNHPFVLIAGNGGGRWYEFVQGTGFLQGAGYRHFLVQGTTQPLRFYQCNPEHARSEANAEIRGSRHVTIYSLKSEGNSTVLKISDSDDVSLFGYGGNASALEGQALFQVTGTPDLLLANLWQKPRTDFGRGDYFAGRAVDPARWSMLQESPPDGHLIRTLPLERPVLYRRGRPRPQKDAP